MSLMVALAMAVCVVVGAASSVRAGTLPEHIAHLRWAEGLVFVYPTWWYGLPAMLKGWLDRVWAPGVAFSMPEPNTKIGPLMTHIRLLGVITTCGAPMWWSHVVGHPGRRTITRGIRALCARRCRTFFMAHYLMDSSTDDSRQRHLAVVAARMDKLIGRRVPVPLPQAPRMQVAE